MHFTIHVRSQGTAARAARLAQRRANPRISPADCLWQTGAIDPTRPSYAVKHQWLPDVEYARDHLLAGYGS